MPICTYKAGMLIQPNICNKIYDIENRFFTQGFIHTISRDYQGFLVFFHLSLFLLLCNEFFAMNREIWRGKNIRI